MLTLPGYQIFEKLHKGPRSSIYRGMKLDDRTHSVIIKVPNTKLPNTTGAERLHYEFEIRKQITSQHVVQCKALIPHPIWGYVLIIEDDQAEVLASQIPATGLELPAFLKIAIQLAKGLYDIHHGNVIHKDIKPSNIIIHPETGIIKYFDFSNASPLRQLKQITIAPHLSTESLAFISPEQTGRMSRNIDYRTDFYSLGVILYQLLCGKLPFIAKNISELIYCHIARQPVPPHEIKPSIPQQVSKMVMKLLQKDAEGRYQSAYGLWKDLIQCMNELTQKGEISSFALAQQDVAEYFYLPQKLYGRELELSQLKAAFDCIYQGNPSVIAITGHAGTGKTVLANETQSYVISKKGYFLTGKFEQKNRTIAYSAINQAFQSLIKQLLTYREEKILPWKNKILTALGNYGQLILDVVPDLESIIGKQPNLPLLDNEQTKNRFYLAFQNLINILAQAEHPLVLFLDDLQWADSASLILIETLMTHPQTQYLLLMIAYRDNEVDHSHPAIITLQTIQKAGTNIQTITLSKLNITAVQQWLSDATKTSLETVFPLANLSYQKTDGNPFFIKVFLQTIYENNLLQTKDHVGWQWDLEKIRQLPSTENVISLMLQQISQLPLATKETLKFASCIGQSFTLPILQIITQKSSEQLISELQPWLENGLLLQTEDKIIFAHDYILDAVYTLIASEDRAANHLTIGRLLQDNLPSAYTSEQLFQILNHFNESIKLIVDKEERLKLAKLNLVASQQTKLAAAYVSSLNYLRLAESYVATFDIWNENYAFAYSLSKELAEVTFLNNDAEESARQINFLLMRAQSILEKIEIYTLLIMQKTLLSHYQEAIDIGYQALSLLGIKLPENNLETNLSIELQRVKSSLENQTIETLLDAPVMQNIDNKAAIKLLYYLAAPAYLHNQNLYTLIGISMVELTLQYGNAEESALGYAIYSALLCSKNEIKTGFQFGVLAIKLSDQSHNLATQCRVNFGYANFIHHWHKPLHQVTNFIERAYQSGLEAGEFQFLGYVFQYKAIYLFYSGTPLETINFELNKFLQLSYVRKNQVVIDKIHAVQLIINLLGHTQHGLEFGDFIKSEIEYEKDWRNNQNFASLGDYLILKTQALYLHGYLDSALASIVEVKQYLPFISGGITITAHNYYHSLILAALYPAVDTSLQQQYWQTLKTNQQQMKIWADQCPENFLHYYKLIAAEMCRISGDILTAMNLYDEAICLVDKTDFIQDKALANELAANFWLVQDKLCYAQGPLLLAYQHYSNWQAKSKMNQLMVQHGQLLKPLLTTNLSSFSINEEITISSSNLGLLDLSSILKASQTISSNIDLSSLLHSMIKVIIENAGAQKGAFFLEESGDLFLQAEYTVAKQIDTLQKKPLLSWKNGARSIIEYAKRTRQPVLLGNAMMDRQFGEEDYIKQNSIKSILCLPVIRANQLKAILYIENNLASYAFTEQHQLILALLASQMAISLENAQFFQSQLIAVEQIATEQRRRAEDVEKHHKDLESFVNMMCHEIRNPMTGVYGNVDFQQQITISLKSFNEDLPHERQPVFSELLRKLEESTQEIQQCTKHQKAIIDDVLDLSKLESGKMDFKHEPFRLKSLIEETAQMFAAPLKQKQLPLRLVLPDIDPWIKGDANRLKIVLINLVANALKFTEQGEICIHLQLIAVSSIHTTFALSVKDTGIGMTAEEQLQLFQRFARVASAEYEGSGLGLLISKRFIERMGGQIDVRSEKDKGSQFTIQLTCETAPAEIKQVPLAAQIAPTPPPAPLPIIKHILVVEDNVVNQRILCRQLEAAGYRCEVANNGQEAVDQWAAASIPFDLIFMDIEMPVMGGLEATQQIRQREQQLTTTKRIPIVALSAYNFKDFIQQAHTVGMDDYITKPYEKNKLYQTAQKWTTMQPEQHPTPIAADTIPVTGKRKANQLSSLPFWSEPPFTEATQAVKIWMPKARRNALYPLLDQLSEAFHRLDIAIIKPEAKYSAKTSSTGWQLYTLTDKAECWAVLPVAQETQAERIIEFMRQSDTPLQVNIMCSGSTQAIVISFSDDNALSTGIEKIISIRAQVLSRYPTPS